MGRFILGFVCVLAMAAVGLTEPSATPADKAALATIVGGATDCTQSAQDDFACNTCGYVKDECTSTSWNFKCETYTNPYNCIACTVNYSAFLCGGRQLEYQTSNCSGPPQDKGPCVRHLNTSTNSGCTTETSCPD
jgi:hypothetical protein